MITKGTRMASINGGVVEVCDLCGLSSDAKPTNVANGSTFLEMDTGDLYMFDAVGAVWWLL